MKRLLLCSKRSEKKKEEEEEHSALQVISLYLCFKICRKEILWNVCIPQLDSGHSHTAITSLCFSLQHRYYSNPTAPNLQRTAKRTKRPMW